jgi:nucleotide-binding universal stress UspA family protein
VYEKILVPLDGSNAAEIVLPYVEEIATKLCSEIIVVGVSGRASVEADHLYLYYLERVTEEAKRQLEGWGPKKEVSARYEFLQGRPAHEILRYANDSDVGMIAMASRGSSGHGPWLLGNIAAKVLRATSRPVLLVRAPASDEVIQQKRLIKRILVPLDGSEIGEAAVSHAEVLARTLSSELVLFQVLEPLVPVGGAETVTFKERREVSVIEYLDSVVKPLKEGGLSVSTKVDTGFPADLIIDYAQANAIDLIAMASHGRAGIGRWVFGSITDKVLHAGDMPVLVVRATEAEGK